MKVFSGFDPSRVVELGENRLLSQPIIIFLDLSHHYKKHLCQLKQMSESAFPHEKIILSLDNPLFCD